jgi:hypothetical protein
VVAASAHRLARVRVCLGVARAFPARHGGEEFVSTAFANALLFWDDNEPISDDDGWPLGEVQIEMPNEGMVELARGAVEITGRRESQQ